MPEENKETETPSRQYDLSCGYVVGMNKEGKLVFEILGNKGLVELLGAHAFASAKVQDTLEAHLNVGSVAVRRGLAQLITALQKPDAVVGTPDEG